jgi:hypothetical protein
MKIQVEMLVLVEQADQVVAALEVTVPAAHLLPAKDLQAVAAMPLADLGPLMVEVVLEVEVEPAALAEMLQLASPALAALDL